MPGHFSHQSLAAALLATTACAAPLAIGLLLQTDSARATEQAVGLRPLIDPAVAQQLEPVPASILAGTTQPTQVNLFAELATSQSIQAPDSQVATLSPLQASTQQIPNGSTSYHVRTAEVNHRDQNTIFAPPVKNIGMVRKNPLIAKEMPQLKRLAVRKFPIRPQIPAETNATASETVRAQPQAGKQVIADAIAPLPPLPNFTQTVAAAKPRPANIQFGSIKNAKTLNPVRPISVPVPQQPTYRTATVDLNRVSQSEQQAPARASQTATAKTVSQRLPAKPVPNHTESLADLLRAEAASEKAGQTVQGPVSSAGSEAPHVARKAVLIRLSDDSASAPSGDNADRQAPATRLLTTPPPATRIMSSSASSSNWNLPQRLLR